MSINHKKEFCDLLKQFFLTTDNSGKTEILGCDEKKIARLEYNLGNTFPSFIKYYLSEFGRQLNVYGKVSLEGSLKESYIEKAISLNDQFGLHEIISKMDVSLTKIIPIYHDFDRDNFQFIVVENGVEILYFLRDLIIDEDNVEIDSDSVDLYRVGAYHNYIRSAVHILIQMYYHDTARKEFLNKHSQYIDLSSFAWSKFHIYKEGELNQDENYLSYRREFNQVVEKREIERGKLFSINEYEVEYIKYLIEEHGVKPIPEVFDPYSYHYTD